MTPLAFFLGIFGAVAGLNAIAIAIVNHAAIARGQAGTLWPFVLLGTISAAAWLGFAATL